tara:strand:+ start:15450 stop:17543 length:2094 start_codon:yes stop_codon:yes gene_type:complete
MFAVSVEAGTNLALFPRAAELDPAVKFWTRVYTEIDTGHGFIHDSKHLDVVYEVISLPANQNHRARDKAIKSAKDRHAQILRLLARGKRSNLSTEEERLLSLWPADVSNTTLRSAAQQLRFQQGQADKFREGLIRSGAWVPHILQTLSEQNLPAELAVLPHVESSFNPNASSHAGAVGLWQFTRSTGQRFMRIDNVVDERQDPYMATVAAVQLLERNYATLGHWPLALTAYNHGVAGMRRAIRSLKTHNIETIIERYRGRTFGFASRNFYPAFLAALDVDRNAVTYFGHLERDLPASMMIVTVPEYLDVKTLEVALNIGRATLQKYNPALREAVWTGRKYVPRNFQLRLPSAHVNSDISVMLTNIPSSERFVRQKRDRSHRVRQGDTLSGIAAQYGVRVEALVSLNRINGKHLIYVGQNIVLPTEKRGNTRTKSVTQEHIPESGEYVVRRGDSIYRITQRFGIGEPTLLRLNPLQNRHKLEIGQVLRLREKNLASPGILVVAEAKTVQIQADAGALNRTTNALNEMKHQQQKTRGELDENVLASVQVMLSADPSDYTVASDQTIEVHALETLGHYAEWLRIRTQNLRTINAMDFGEHVVSGTRLKLVFSRVTEEVFESRRLSYHQGLQEKFFNQFRIRDTHPHTVQRGESVWGLALKKYQVPVWLLRQYNPDLDLNRVSLGEHVNIPVLERVAETTG